MVPHGPGPPWSPVIPSVPSRPRSVPSRPQRTYDYPLHFHPQPEIDTELNALVMTKTPNDSQSTVSQSVYLHS
eukprot:3409755-Prymnesium_polylepis.1